MSRNNNQVQVGIVVALVVLILGIGYIGVNTYPALEESMGSVLVDRRGKEVATSELHSKDYVLIYFSASWCPPCQKFTPKLVDYYEEHSDEQNFEVVFVSADTSASDMKKYMRKHRMPWLAVPYHKYGNREKLKALYGNRGGIPNLVVVDADGSVLESSYQGGRYVGPEAVLEEFELYY